MKVCSWGDLATEAPDVADFGKRRLDGKVAYLATVRASGLPRTQPVTPIVEANHCFIFADPESSKVRDLELNPHFNLHCGMSDSSGSSGEFQITGTVKAVSDPIVRQQVESNCTFRPSQRFLLYELQPGEAVATSYRGGRASRKRWQSDPQVTG